jgi:transcriptional regulator with XRE-family HTH domain
MIFVIERISILRSFLISLWCFIGIIKDKSVLLRNNLTKMVYHKQIAENIRRFRELKNLTRDQMAADIDMSLSGYGKLERGEVDISISKLYKIAEILNVSVSQMMNFDVSNIFNVSGNQTVNGVEVQEQNHFGDQYKEKYIAMLEAEVERLKALVKS